MLQKCDENYTNQTPTLELLLVLKWRKNYEDQKFRQGQLNIVNCIQQTKFQFDKVKAINSV